MWYVLRELLKVQPYVRGLMNRRNIFDTRLQREKSSFAHGPRASDTEANVWHELLPCSDVTCCHPTSLSTFATAAEF